MRSVLAIIVIVLLTGSINAQVADNQLLFKLMPEEKKTTILFEDGRLIASSHTDQFEELTSRFEIESINCPFKTLDKKLQLTYLLKIDENASSKADVRDRVMEYLHEMEFIEYVEYLPIFEMTAEPNDPSYSQQWHLPKINASSAWDISLGNPNVVIAIVDDAVRRDHEDLQSIIFTNPNEIPGNGLDDDNNGYIDDVNGWDAANLDNDASPPPNNLFYHGTHVAGIASAVTNNVKGIASIGHGTSILPVKTKWDASTGPYLQATLQGIDYAISCGYTDVVNMSFGSSSYYITFQNLINAGHALGIVFVAAAGNSNTSAPHYPSAYNHVISVAASNQNDIKAGFSNYGPSVDVTAPGTNILSTVAASATSYDNLQGTSMASPLVAGLCGLMLSYDPSANPEEIEFCLKMSADNIDVLNPGYVGQLGAGRINATMALACLNGVPEADFESDNTFAGVGQEIQFLDISNGNSATSWEWNFPGGDPDNSTLAEPIVTYASPGSYSVTLSAINDEGADAITKTDYITIGVPSASLSGNASIVFGGSAFLRIDLTGNPPFSITYTDGSNNTTINNIMTNPYYLSVSPAGNTQYQLVDMSDLGCAGTVSGSSNVQLLAPGSGGSTAFLKMYGGDQADVAQTFIIDDAGDIIICGNTDSYGNGGRDATVTKTDEDGNIIWEKAVGGPNYDQFSSIVESSDGNYYLGGLTFVPGTSDRRIIVSKLTSTGDLLWTKQINNEGLGAVLDIQELSNGKIMVIGRSNTSGTDYKTLVITLDEDGTLNWGKQYTYAINFLPYNALELDGGDIWVASGTGTGSNYQASIMSLDSQGNVNWTKQYGGNGNDKFRDVISSSDGNFIAVGSSWSFGSPAHDILETFIVKMDLTGDLIWAKTHRNGYGQETSVADVAHTSTNNLLFTVGGTNKTGRYVGFGEMDENGNSLKYIQSNDSLTLYGYHVDVDASDNLVACGMILPNIGHAENLLFKMDKNLNGLDCIFDEQQITVETVTSFEMSTNISGADLNSIQDLEFNAISYTSAELTGSCGGDESCTKQNNVWAFGKNILMDFNTNPPTLSNESLMDAFFEGCSSISSYSGRLQYYTDGESVFRVNSGVHSIMPNGSDLAGFQSSTQAALLVKNPGLDHIHYVFTAGWKYSNSSYVTVSTINANLDGGNGDIVVTPTSSYETPKNTRIEFTKSEKLAGVMASQERTWVLINDYESDEYKAYAVEAGGVNLTPVVSNSIITQNGAELGQLKFSHDRSMVAAAFFAEGESTNNIEVADFNLLTGELSGNRLYTVPRGIYGVEFSANNQFLYCSVLWIPGPRVLQINLQTDVITILHSDEYDRSEYASLQLAPNGKIYVANDTAYAGEPGVEGSKFSVIDQPDLDGLACDFQFHAIDVPAGSIIRRGLPNLVAAIINCEGDSSVCPENSSRQTSICQGESRILTAGNGSNYFWSPNDHISDQFIQNPEVDPEVSTTYTVTYLNEDACSITDTIIVVVEDVPDLGVQPDSAIICSGESVNLLATGASSYLWSTSAGLSNTIIPDPVATPTSSTQYQVIGANASANCFDTAFVWIEVLTCCGAQAGFIANDTNICVGDSILFTNTSISNGQVEYFWTFENGSPSIFNGEHPPFITFNSVGAFTVSLTMEDDCGIDTYSMPIFVHDEPQFNIQSDTFICLSEEILLSLGDDQVEGYVYSWSPIDGLNDASSSDPLATILGNITYTVEVEDLLTNCIAQRSVDISVDPNCDCSYYIPNAFSPNHDNINDHFSIRSDALSALTISIYNRWGELVYESDELNFKWDGTYKGKRLSTDVFAYYAELICRETGNTTLEKGNITIVK